jgi:predicted MPP superfamily phosphohydrolase
VRTRLAVPLGLLTSAVLCGGYATGIERVSFRLRRVEVPVLPHRSRPLRVLHLSDAHLLPGQRRKRDWVRTLDGLHPDLVVNTGDSIAHPEAVPAFLDSLGPLLDRPGVFILGSNDYYSPRFKNPLAYLWPRLDRRRYTDELPWKDLRDGMVGAGWLDLSNARGSLRVDGRRLSFAGVDDPHIRRDRYDLVAGAADSDADLTVGVTHSPEPRVLDRFAADGYRLLFAGHTHGGQLRVPGFGAVVTNCGLDRARARGLSRYGVGRDPAWLHVSAGLGTSPYAPARFACPPEATLLTLVAGR